MAEFTSKSDLDIAKERTEQNKKAWNDIINKSRSDEEKMSFEGYDRKTNPVGSAWAYSYTKKESPKGVETPVTPPVTTPVTPPVDGDLDTQESAYKKAKRENSVRQLISTYIPETPTNIPTFSGETSYFTKTAMQEAFDKMYNDYMGGKYSIKSYGAYNNGINTKALRNDPNYNNAWNNFSNNYRLEGGWLTGSYVYQNPDKIALREREELWHKNNPQPAMRGPLGGGFTPEYEKYLQKYKAAQAAGFNKQGGTMNRINYFQQGGLAPQQNMQDLVINLVQTAMDQQNPNSAKAMETINKIMEAAKAGDEKSMKLAQMIQQVIKLMLGQATSAKWGSKLQYLKSLKYARGGKTCPACMQGGGKSDSTLVNGKYPKHWTIEQKIKYEQEHPVDEAKVADELHKTRLEEKNKNNKKVKQKTEKKACGGKTKKHYFGGWL